MLLKLILLTILFLIFLTFDIWSNIFLLVTNKFLIVHEEPNHFKCTYKSSLPLIFVMLLFMCYLAFQCDGPPPYYFCTMFYHTLISWQSPKIEWQYGLKSKAAIIALQCRLHVKRIAALFFILYSCLILVF